MPDAALARLAAHLPCLEAAAADESAPSAARSRVAAVAALTRTALEAAGHRMAQDAAGQPRMVPDALTEVLGD